MPLSFLFPLSPRVKESSLQEVFPENIRPMDSIGECSLRRMTQTDLTDPDELLRLAGWNQTPEDWCHMLELQPEGCFVAEAQSKTVLGTVTTITYGGTIAWIGMMLVHPDHRRKGIGRALMVSA